MSIYSKLGPLQWQVPIVDKDGRPTPEFARYFQQIFGNGEYLAENKQDQDDDLDAISEIITTGYLVRTGNAPASYVTRSITVTVGHLTVADGDGVAAATELGLPDTGVVAGAYTNANIAVDDQGRVTAASSGASGTFFTDELAQDAVGGILVDSATIDFTYDDGTPSITGSVKADSIGPTELADTAVTPDTYGDATHVPQFTVDQQGRITGVTEVAISGGGGGTGYRPMVDGSDPPVFILGPGNDLIMTEI